MPDYTKWCKVAGSDANKKKKVSGCNPVFVGIIWIIFMLNNVLVLVILLNFLISIIGQSYEKVWTYKEIYIYRNKMDLNSEYYAMMNFFGWDETFTSLKIFTPIRKIGQQSLDDYKGFSQQIMNYILM
jgi:hypothetical protein